MSLIKFNLITLIGGDFNLKYPDFEPDYKVN